MPYPWRSPSDSVRRINMSSEPGNDVVLVKFRNLKVGHDLAFRAGMGFQGKGGS
jgi:hypothetical protein